MPVGTAYPGKQCPIPEDGIPKQTAISISELAAFLYSPVRRVVIVWIMTPLGCQVLLPKFRLNVIPASALRLEAECSCETLGTHLPHCVVSLHVYATVQALSAVTN